MKKLALFQVAFFVWSALLMGVAQAQNQPESLGEIAARVRRSRATHTRRSRVITNDDLLIPPATQVVTRRPRSGDSAPTAPPPDGSSSSQPVESGAAGPKGDSSGSVAEAQQKLADQWRSKIADQKARIALLQRELDVAERETRMRQAVFYSDAGARLRDPGQFDQQNLKDHDEIESKRAALTQANAELDAMKEEIRKAGLNSRIAD